MNDRVRGTVQNFIRNLSGTDAAEVTRYTHEITSNKEFHKRLEADRNNFGRRRFSDWGIGTTLVLVLYILCRKLRPDSVVETGVASGVSSSYILCGLEENKHGILYSIDLTWGEEQSGWIIPDYLKHRWQLIMGRSSNKLPPLLEKLGTIDIFLHDSEHTYRNMLWEYQTAWAHIKTSGILLSHNIDTNDAFPDFCHSVKHTGYVLSNLGAIVKT